MFYFNILKNITIHRTKHESSFFGFCGVISYFRRVGNFIYSRGVLRAVYW